MRTNNNLATPTKLFGEGQNFLKTQDLKTIGMFSKANNDKKNIMKEVKNNLIELCKDLGVENHLEPMT